MCISPRALTSLASREEWDLLWLARECLVEPLPPDWEEVLSEGGQPQFLCHSTGELLDHHPADEHFRQQLAQMRAAPRDAEAAAERAWMAFRDEAGEEYWHNWAEVFGRGDAAALGQPGAEGVEVAEGIEVAEGGTPQLADGVSETAGAPPPLSQPETVASEPAEAGPGEAVTVFQNA